MIIYLTFGDPPSGIYEGQVIDVVRFINSELHHRIKLVAFISGRDFFKNRKIIKKNLPGSIVLPMFPKMINWEKNRFIFYLICVFFRPRVIIARNVLATQLALLSKRMGLTKEIVFDGRGAIAAEWNEYNVVNEKELKANIFNWEKEVVLQSNRQIAVSNRLVEYWKREFGFQRDTNVIIPCTINKSFESIDITGEAVKRSRSLLGIDDNKIILAYSGSIAGWQSFSILSDFLEKIMKGDDRIVLYFLSKRTKEVEMLAKAFPRRVFQEFVKPEEVGDRLTGCDYGLLIREQNTTNDVASPVKFAEYLSCGLKVIISEGIGDYSSFVVREKCGHLSNDLDLQLQNLSLNERKRNQQIAHKFFRKENYIKEYNGIV